MVPLLIGLAIGVGGSHPTETYELGRSVYEFAQNSPVRASVIILCISALALTPYILLVAAVAAGLYASATVLPINLPLPAPLAQQLLMDPAKKLLSNPFAAVEAAGKVNRTLSSLSSSSSGAEVVAVESTLAKVRL